MIKRFIGKDGSLGYRTGQIYRLIERPYKNYPIAISQPDGSGLCPYSSLESFNKNWEDIK